jgi:hypothetical protein
MNVQHTVVMGVYGFELDEEKFCLISPPGTILLNLYITEEPLESLLISKYLKQ